MVFFTYFPVNPSYFNNLLTYYFSILLECMTGGSQNRSVSLAPIHERQIDLIQERVKKVTLESVNRSQAIQIALLAFQETPRLKELVEVNKAADQRRRNGKAKAR